jgi:hypothetical protein
MMTNENPPPEVVSPFEDERGKVLIDMSKHAGIAGKALRVELRRTRDPAMGAVPPGSRIVDPHCVVGLISPKALPAEGEHFLMAYHSLSGITDFGNIDSHEPISNVVIEDSCYYFETSEGSWRLKILNVGN